MQTRMIRNTACSLYCLRAIFHHYGLEQLGYSYYGGFDSFELQPQNRVTAFAYGFESSLRYQPDMHTNLGLSYSLVKIDEDLETGSTAIDTVLFDEGATSKHQLVLWADRQITNRLLLSAQLRKASALSDPYYGDLKLEPVLDLAARYQVTPGVEFNMAITNLTDTNKEEIIFGLPQQREMWLGIGITF